MASFNDNTMPVRGTTFYVGSWVFVADGSGGFHNHLIGPSAPKTSDAAQCREVDEIVDQLDKIPLPVHVKEIRDQPDFDVTTTKSLSELEEDRDNLLETTKQEAIVDREVSTSEFHQDSFQDNTVPAVNEISPITIKKST